MTREERAYVERKRQEALETVRRHEALEALPEPERVEATKRLAICPHHHNDNRLTDWYRAGLAPAELDRLEAMPCPICPPNGRQSDGT